MSWQQGVFMKPDINKPDKNKRGSKGGGRNLHAIAPIMRKGGVHEKSEGAKRSAARRELRHAVRENHSRQTIGRGHSADADSIAA
jgi:hypothetical protein